MDMKETKELFEHDFKALLSKVSKNYNPANLTALANVGVLLLATMKLSHEDEKEEEEARDDIRDELMGAEKYYKRWQETANLSYKQLAKDELRHADFFIKHARMMTQDATQQDKLQSYIEWYDTLSARLA